MNSKLGSSSTAHLVEVPSDHDDQEKNAQKLERTGGGGVRDRTCWTMFLSSCLLISGFVSLFVYSLWESPASGAAVPMHSFEYFLYCMLGGVLSGFPHTLLTPVDLIKCRVQCGEYSSLSDGINSLWAEGLNNRPQPLSTLKTLLLFCRGWAPTFVGYSLQGALKFGLYELFKYVYAYHVFGYETVMRHRVLLFLLASANAELIADIGLSPWEAVKVKMQTTRTYPPVLNIVIPRMFFTEGFSAFYKGLPALWGRQIPYTMMKFASFEKTVEIIYTVILATPKSEVSHSGQLAVSLVSGVVAGALCCIVSHPADTLVSKLNQRTDSRGPPPASPTTGTPSGEMMSDRSSEKQEQSIEKTGGRLAEDSGGAGNGGGGGVGVVALVKELGCAGLWKGIGARLLMISTITALQWLIYDSFKVAVGLPTTGGGGGAKSGAAATMAPAVIAAALGGTAPVPSGMPK